VCLQTRIAPRSACQAHAALHRPPGYTGGYGHPAAADAAASALRALRRAALATRRGVPPALRVLPDVPGPGRACLSAAHTVAASRSAVCRPCRALSSLLWLLSAPHVSRGRARRVSRHATPPAVGRPRSRSTLAAAQLRVTALSADSALAAYSACAVTRIAVCSGSSSSVILGDFLAN
jgi:hypothetical protein